MIIDIVQNHMVLAYRVEGNVISIYDPNYSQDDTITLTMGKEIIHSGVGKVRGFYRPNYQPKSPP